MRHPVILAGFFVVIALGLIAGALTLIDSGRAPSPTSVVAARPTATVAARAEVVPSIRSNGVAGTTARTTTVRAIPRSDVAALGTIPHDELVVIDGRTSDSKWLRIVFPPESSLHGWVDSSFVTIDGDASKLVVATAEPQPVVRVPTASAPYRASGGTSAGAVRVATAPAVAATAAPTISSSAADLVIGGTDIRGGKLTVTVINKGTAAYRGAITVSVTGGRAGPGGGSLASVTIAPGQSTVVATGYVLSPSDRLQIAVAAPAGESNVSNNSTTIAFASSG